ncbi:MAG: hypothetical protein K0R80_1152 [Clostridia bacterium]|jgi:hypothetical protein|nr:hypothetical protein [Clostridia bacterium]
MIVFCWQEKLQITLKLMKKTANRIMSPISENIGDNKDESI